MTKREIRRHNKAIRNELTKELMNEYNKKIRNRLFGSEQFLRCQMLFTYISFGKEVDTHEIIDKALQMNKQVYVPRVEYNECHASRDTLMNFYEIRSLDNLIRSDFGILEPSGDNHYKYVSSLTDNKNKLMLLPGLAFDLKGNRIGYGAGHYDRYISRFSNNEWEKIALAYDFQIINNVTVDIYDIPADYIITPEKFIICKG